MVTTSIFQKNTTTVRLITYIYTHNHIQADADTDVEYTKFCCLVPDSFTPEAAIITSGKRINTSTLVITVTEYEYIICNEQIKCSEQTQIQSQIGDALLFGVGWGVKSAYRCRYTKQL